MPGPGATLGGPPLPRQRRLPITSVAEAAGVVQWQNGSFPSCTRGFDSPHPLHLRPRNPEPSPAPPSLWRGACVIEALDTNPRLGRGSFGSGLSNRGPFGRCRSLRDCNLDAPVRLPSGRGPIARDGIRRSQPFRRQARGIDPIRDQRGLHGIRAVLRKGGVQVGRPRAIRVPREHHTAVGTNSQEIRKIFGSLPAPGVQVGLVGCKQRSGKQMIRAALCTCWADARSLASSTAIWAYCCAR